MVLLLSDHAQRHEQREERSPSLGTGGGASRGADLFTDCRAAIKQARPRRFHKCRMARARLRDGAKCEVERHWWLF